MLEVAVVRRVAELVGDGDAELAGRVLLLERLEAVGLRDRLVHAAEGREALGVAAVVGAVGVEEVVGVDQLAAGADVVPPKPVAMPAQSPNAPSTVLAVGVWPGSAVVVPGPALRLRTDDREGDVLGGGRSGGGEDEGQAEARDE